MVFSANVLGRTMKRDMLVSGVVIAGIVGIAAGGGIGESCPEQAIWHSHAASSFEEGFPLGNGRIGATVFGGAQTERTVLNEATLWSGGPVDPSMNLEAHTHLPGVRAALENEDYPLADERVKKIQGKNSESFAPLGDLYIDMNHPGTITDYTRKLDLREGIVRIRYQAGETEYSREIFVSHPDQILVIKLSADRKGALDFTLRLDSQLQHQKEIRTDGILMKGRAPVHVESYREKDPPIPAVYEETGGTRFAVLAAVFPQGGSLRHTDAGLSVYGADEVLLLVSIATSFNGFDKNPQTQGRDETALARQFLENASSKSYLQLKESHIRDFRRYFDRVSLQLNDSPAPELPTDERLQCYTNGESDNDLEALYFQFGRYLLISCSRPGGPPANLQGIWNPYLRPPWRSNYTTNINLQMNYWPAEVCNLSEMHEPLLRFLPSLSQTGKVTARTFLGTGGWCGGHNSDIWASTHPVGDFGKGRPCWAAWYMGGAWLSTHLWEHYEFTRDVSFLREQGYELMKGAAQFCLEWLVEDKQGNLITSPSTSPENFYITPDVYKGATCFGAAGDLAIIRELFRDTLEAARILNVDEPLQEKLKQALAKLYPYQVGAKGNLQEWYYDWEDSDPKHRHVSHLIGLYPGRHISPQDTERLAAACRRSLELRGDGGTGWSLAWKICLWARLLDGNHAHTILRTLLTYREPVYLIGYAKGGTYPNLWDCCPPFQIDGNLGAAAGIAEMLIQSHRGEIHLLPALPDAWETGSVKGLCARGGLEIDMAWKNHQLSQAAVRCRKETSCMLRYRDKTVPLSVKPDGEIRLDGELNIQH